jgi:tRNA (guanosine-2'-O-)-methyltransferase
MKTKPKETISELTGFITENRLETFNRVLAMRTRYITLVLEDIYQPHNASAVLRSCECFGIQDVHIIENRNEYRINKDVVMGAQKWINIHRYRKKDFNSADAVSILKKNGYRVVATTVGEGSVQLEDFDIAGGKFALCFGTELTGLSDTLLELADESVSIPMLGFTDSFNISVSAAIFLHHLRLKLNSSGIPWQLDDPEQDEIMINWLRRSIKHLRGRHSDSPDRQEKS